MKRALRHGPGLRGASLSRLFVALTLVFFSVPQGQSNWTLAHAGRAAHSEVELAGGIISVHRHLLCAQKIDDHSPDMATLGGKMEADQPSVVAAMSLVAPQLSSPIVRILLPARGPPEV